MFVELGRTAVLERAFGHCGYSRSSNRLCSGYHASFAANFNQAKSACTDQYLVPAQVFQTSPCALHRWPGTGSWRTPQLLLLWPSQQELQQETPKSRSSPLARQPCTSHHSSFSRGAVAPSAPSSDAAVFCAKRLHGPRLTLRPMQVCPPCRQSNHAWCHGTNAWCM